MNPIEQIKDRLSILDVVSTYVKLEKSGSQYKGRCPFHNEKTPSFYVSPNYNSFHCFGCSKAGDIFSFVEEIEHIPFREALEMLGERAGVDVKKGKKTNDTSLLKILSVAQLFYTTSLQGNKEALLYLQERGVFTETQELFSVGFATNEWRSLATHLQKKGFTDEDGARAGLTIKTEKGYYDRWRGRVMFPLHNTSGKVVGFTGRVLPIVEQASPKPLAKYVNSPETEVFHKSKILYGYHLARSSIATENACILVEGQLDVILSHQSGIRNVVGVSGTAFSEEQLALLKRLTDTLIFCFDADSAGIEALKRSVKLAFLMDFEIKVITLPAGSDPADIIKQDASLWHASTKETVSVIHFLTKILLTQTETASLPKAIIKELFPIVQCLPSAMKQDNLLAEIAKITNIQLKTLEQDFKKFASLHVDESVTEKVTAVVPVNGQNLLEEIVLELLAIDIIEKNADVYKESVKNLYKDYGVLDTGLLDMGAEQVSRFIMKNELLQSDARLFKKHSTDLLRSLEIILIENKILEIDTDPETPDLQKKIALLQKKDTIRTKTSSDL